MIVMCMGGGCGGGKKSGITQPKGGNKMGSMKKGATVHVKSGKHVNAKMHSATTPVMNSMGSGKMGKGLTGHKPVVGMPRRMH